MARLPQVPLHRHLVVLALAGLLPLAIACGVGLVHLYGRQREVARERAQEVTRALATAVDSELRRTETALEMLAASAALRRGDLESYRTVLERSVAAARIWRNVIVSDPNARPLINTRIAPAGELPAIMDLESHAVAVRTRAATVGGIVRGPHAFAFAVRMPVVDNGEVLYVLSAVVDPSAIQRIVLRQNVPEGWLVSVFDAQGRRVARTVGGEQVMGIPMGRSLQELVAKGGDEGSGSTTTVEGWEVFSAFTRVPASGWIVVNGVPVDVVEREALKTVAVYAAAVLASILIGLAAVFLVARRLKKPIAELRAIVDDREALLMREQEARNAAEHASIAKDQFLAMLGHELRNPLAALSNAAQLLDREGVDAANMRRAREVISRQVRHLSRLTDDLLDVARAMHGKIDLERVPMDLGAAAADTLATLASTQRTARHRIETDLREAWIDADPVRIDQILGNLVVNAVKYTPPGGTIRVSTWREGERSYLSVADDGAGLSPELAGKVFDLFVQGDREQDRAQGGLGIGLTLVRRLAQLHGGEVEVRSEGEGQGAEFIVRFPA